MITAYHAGTECLRGGVICPTGKNYIEEVKK